MMFDRQERQPGGKKININDLDAGLAIVLITLLYGYLKTGQILFLPPIGVLVLAMIQPRIFCWFTRVWSGLAQKMGSVSTHILLTLVFYGVLTPVAFITRLFRIDSLKLTSWKSGKESLFKKRDHLHAGTDLDHPY